MCDFGITAMVLSAAMTVGSAITQTQAIDAQAQHANDMADLTLQQGERGAAYARARGRVQAEQIRRKGDSVKATQRVGYAAGNVFGATVDDMAYTTEMDIRTDERLALQGAAVNADDILNRAAVGAFSQRPVGTGYAKAGVWLGAGSSLLGTADKLYHYSKRPGGGGQSGFWGSVSG